MEESVKCVCDKSDPETKRDSMSVPDLDTGHSCRVQSKGNICGSLAENSKEARLWKPGQSNLWHRTKQDKDHLNTR